MKSVVYQESANNFTDTRQNIKGAQIATIKAFGVGIPVGAGDFVGQLGSGMTAQGESLLYVYNGTDWKLVGQSGPGSLPDTVVQENLKNNFTEIDQRIEDCQIPYVDMGTRAVNSVAIKGPGHIYILDVTPPKIYMAMDGTEWTQIQTEHDNNSGDVKLNAANDFSHPDQRVMGRAITTILKGPNAPTVATIPPTREGEIYVQLAEGTADRKARMWISNNSGGWKWESLSHISDLPNTVVQTSKNNDFQPTQQTIAGNQILSFIDGGDQTPAQSGAKPDYEGQFYMAVHTNIQGNKDVAIWVANGNQWLPIQQDIELATIARTDKSNRFSQPHQILGEGGPDARWLTGARIKFSGHSPLADTHWRVQNVGEITVYENSTAVPREISVWVGVSINPDPNTNAGEWAMVWSNKQGAMDNIAFTDERNEFIPLQYINNGGKKSLINTGHEGGAGSPRNHVVPVAPGDTYTQSYSHPGYGETRNLWMAAIEADTTSWKRMLAADDKDVILSDKENHFLTRNQYLGDISDTKRDRIMGARYHIAGSPTGIVGIAPTMFGEVVVTEKYDPNFPSDVDEMIVEAHLAVGFGDQGRKSWIKIGEAKKKALQIIDDGTNN